MTPRASIIIVCFGRRDMTERCLASLDRTLGPALGGEIELVLVDNASPDDTLELLGAWRDRARVVALPENRNFAGGCNAGAAAARGDALIFLNNDTIMEPGVLEALADTVAEPGVGAAGPRLLYADGTIQHAGVVMLDACGEITPFHVFHHLDGELSQARGVYEMEAVTGACLAVPRPLFEDLGGFDEAFVNGLEDIDLCLRIRMRGLAIVYRGDLAFVHDEGASRAGQDDLPNQRHFAAKWAALLGDDSEMARTLWGAPLRTDPPPRSLPSGSPVLVGQPSGIGGAADELRALLVGFEEVGLPATALDNPLAFVTPELHGAVARAHDLATRRAAPATGILIAVPSGPAATTTAQPGALVRVARASDVPATATPLPAVPHPAGWAPPAIAVETPVGPGGEGLLVAAAPEDLARLGSLLSCWDGRVRIALTFRGRGAEARAAAAVPGAELVPPPATDEDWARAAATADVAMCLDRGDRFERRALVAAAVGATPVAAPDGPARAVLGDLARSSLEEASRGPRADRHTLATTVRDACAPARVATQIVELVNAHRTARAA